MVENLDNTKGPYNVIPYHNIPNHIKYQKFQTALTQSFVKLGVVVDLDNTYKLYPAIPYHTTIYQVIPNTKYFKQS